YGEVSAAGGYRAYYDGSREGTLQGAGTAGGLGLDAEFFESVLLPQFVVDGLLGLRAEPEGVVLDPRLPADWPELTVTRIRFRNLTFDVRATHTTIELRIVSSTPAEKNSFRVRAGDGWTPEEVALDSTAAPGATLTFTRK
ncbi:MAG: glycosyl hydrolase family 65 protein, partial [Candidatus Hydrogenedentota bacterium]